ncbi:GNAT family N-acetyltransferase [Kitasatospora sp. CM 4170]|uniref:GNAT family N-acetyltransferase n=1 Tax=Kitasatospora aburaviensis TaxID=67265 RepID=A0ABW1EPG0_9ACTN|nr:GNAT family N-acetyltransferase [Kitasatospora sp. CM 4170]WNM48504.1 GNAT family N-acetyltransferase [Kitasatospora sp. CM 4170]
MYTVERLTADELEGAAGQLAALLLETVGAGASLGFLSSLDAEGAAGWWRALVPDVAAGRLLLWTARAEADGRIAGTVQLRPAVPANGRHRGEVAKLMVHPADRGQRLAGRLLTTLEAGASERGIRLLVLDTETGSPAERMYEAAGWTRVGTVPDFATDPAGVSHPTTVFFKQLTAASGAPDGA